MPEKKRGSRNGSAADPAPSGKAKPYRTGERLSRFRRELRSRLILAGLILLASFSACTPQQKQIGIPGEVQATIDAVTEEIAAGNDDRIYQEAADEWRQASTPDQSREFFKTLRTKLGKVKNRVFHMARGEENAGGTKVGQSYVVQYQTAFENADGMETFTLVKRNGRWMLARYFVNSEALK